MFRSILHHKQFRYLGAFYIHTLVRLFAVSIFQIFSGIYVFQTLKGFGVTHQQSLGLTALFFALIFLIHALAITPALWLITKKGLRFAVFWGNVFLIAFFMSLYISQYDPIFFIVTAFFSGLQIGLYWTAYHLYMATLTDDKSQGKEIAFGSSLSAIAAIGGPAFGGLIITYFGFTAAFTVMSVLILIANLPLRYLPRQNDKINVNILETVKALAPRKEIKSYIGLFGAGITDTVVGTFWPIYIFPILAGFIGVGFVGSLIALIATIATLMIGYLVDKYGAKRVIQIVSSLDSLVWILMFFATTPPRIYLASVLQALTLAGQIIGIDSLVYERARHFNIVAFIVQREVGLAVGKFGFMFVLGILFWFGMPIMIVFVFAAIASLLTRFYPADTPQHVRV